MSTVCAVDVGTSVIKAALYDRSLHALAGARSAVPVVRDGDRAEADPELLWSTFARTVAELMRRAPVRPDRLAITAQMAGLVLLDGDDRPLRPAILGIDRRGASSATAPERYTGCLPGGIYPAHKLRWLAAHEPGVLERTRRIGGIKEFLLLRLTGAWVTDRSSASATALYDQERDVWCSHAGALPRIAAARDAAGAVLPDAARRCGLPPALPVVVGIGDGPAANLAADAVGPHRLCLSVGTTTVARLLVDSAPPPLPIPLFTQRLDAGWRCIGMRFDPVAPDLLVPLGRPGQRLPRSAVPAAVRPLIDAYGVRELRPVLPEGGARSLPGRWDLPVRDTGVHDGTRGAALLAAPQNPLGGTPEH